MTLNQPCLPLPQLRSASSHFIAATHTTPFKGYEDQLNFRLTSYNFFTCCHVSVGSCDTPAPFSLFLVLLLPCDCGATSPAAGHVRL